MGETKPVSVRIDVETLHVLEGAGVKVADVMRDAAERKAREVRADAWAARVKARMWKPLPGFPPSETLIREDRDRR